MGQRLSPIQGCACGMSMVLSDRQPTSSTFSMLTWAGAKQHASGVACCVSCSMLVYLEPQQLLDGLTVPCLWCMHCRLAQKVAATYYVCTQHTSNATCVVDTPHECSWIAQLDMCIYNPNLSDYQTLLACSGSKVPSLGESPSNTHTDMTLYVVPAPCSKAEMAAEHRIALTVKGCNPHPTVV